MKTGIDIVEVSRISRLIAETDFIKRYFSDAEQKLFSSKTDCTLSVAGNFAAKEAFSKALGTGVRGFKLNEISVLRDALGKPYFEVSENIQSTLSNMGVTDIDVSVSHEQSCAIANVIFTVDKKFSAFKKAVESEKTYENAINSALVKGYLRPRRKDSHKGDYGKLFAVCGSPAYMGAGVMSTTSALKCGSGLVTIACGKSLNTAYKIAAPEVMTYPLSDNDGIIDADNISGILTEATKADTILIGCGMTSCDFTKKLVTSIITSDIKCPVVLDADGINVLTGYADILKNASMPVILTPHLMEFSRLSELNTEYIKENKITVAKDFSKKYGVYLVLKSDKTIVSTPDGQIYENIIGNPGMAKGGSGDVLAGCIASFVAQNVVSAKKEGTDIYTAILRGVLTGVYIHSLSGDMACADLGEDGILPTDIMENIPYAVKYLKTN